MAADEEIQRARKIADSPAPSVRRIRVPESVAVPAPAARSSVVAEPSREPTTWDPSRVARVVRRRARRARNRCEIAEDVQVTAYVSRRGRVVSAGAATTTEEDAARLDCIAEQVRRWPMPRAARLAKVTFDLT